jgi:PAS domain S-box-containing protein
MHFVGMLAFEMGAPAAYDLGITALSLLVAVTATAAAFGWVAIRGAAPRSLLVAGPLMGLGVAAMHYVGMAAMRIPGDMAYAPAIVLASIAIAVSAATAALWLAFRRNRLWQKLVAACIMGLAVAGMHYTGMAAASFTLAEGGAQAAHGAVPAAGPQNLALAVAGVTVVILFLAMMAGSLDQGRVQRRLHVSEARFRAAVRAVDGVMWNTNAAGELVEEQPGWEQITGQSFADYRGGGWTRVLHPDDAENARLVWEAAVRTGTPYVVDQRVRHPDGDWRHYAVRAVPVHDADGTIREWVGVHVDVTGRHAYEAALREARDAAEEASRAKSRFLANMSHELRTPLSAVIGYAEMLEEEAEDLGQDSFLSDLGKIRANAQHLLGLINDVLDLSKVEAEKMDVYAEDFAVEAFARDAAATVEALVAKKGNRLVLDLAPDLGAARTDSVKLRQCLFNLLGNAAKFTEGGTITLRVRRFAAADGDRLSFAVVDTGIGMSPEQVAGLFQRFAQADETTTRKYGGTGLGLALTRAFAGLMGGDVVPASIEGQGTTFTLTVPAVLPAIETPEAEAPEAQTEHEAAGSRGLVLVVDDEASQRDLLARFLIRQGFSVRTAGDGRTGLDLARTLAPRVILLDVMMPEVDGWTVLSTLKADGTTRDIPVVMVSFVADAALSASLGAADALPKPVDWGRLKAVLTRLGPEPGGVLVVDDDAGMRERLRHVLERDGWSVREAGDGAEALARVDEARPAVILLDLTMPVMDGFSFLLRLRALPGCADIPVVVLSARDISPAERNELAGVDRVVRKGDASLQELAAEVARLGQPPEAAAAETP